VARRVRSLARVRKTSASRVLTDLVESGLESKDAERRRFFLLVEQLAQTEDAAEQARLKAELARLTFGE
jgi:DNA-binding IclR family transcriptional regulator